MTLPPSQSPFSMRSAKYIERGLSIVPIAPGTKKPGEFTGGEWRGMGNWDRFFARVPSLLDLAHWDKWPDAGLGLICGKISGIVAVDVDTDDKFMLEQLRKRMPPSPVMKKGRKGYTAFYRYSGQLPRSWDVNKERIVDLLSDGRQTLMPGTMHPDGMSYVYLTEDTLEDFDLADLPELPKDFEEKLDLYLGGMQTAEDKAARRAPQVPREEDTNTTLLQGIASRLFREINTQALNRIDEWVPLMIPGAKPDAKGYRCRAFWRDAENPNVGITTQGIRDFGGNIGLTPIDLVMYAQNVRFDEASESLRKLLGIGGTSVTMTINGDVGVPMPEKPKGDLSAFKTALVRPAAKPATSTPAAPQRPRNAPLAAPRADADPMAAALLAAQREQAEEAEAAEVPELPDFIINAPGMIGQIADWINATAPKPQPEFAVAAALAIGSAAMARRFRSNQNNFTPLYFVMVATSGGGKDHPQKCIRRVLAKAGLEGQISGAYASGAGLMTTLQRAPAHIAIIDEIGQMMKQANSQSGSHVDGAVTQLLMAFGTCDGMMSPAAYSEQGMPKAMRSKGDFRVYNPCITLVGATTPETFFGNMTEDRKEGGFLNRLICIQSHVPRQLSRMPVVQDPSTAIIDWCKEIVAESQALGDMSDVMAAEIEAVTVPMIFAPECELLLRQFEQDLNDRMDAMDTPANAELLVRTREKAMRMAMIVAKATNAPRDNMIRYDALDWAIRYVRHYDLATVRAVESRAPVSRIESQIVQLIGLIKKCKTYKDKTLLYVTSTGALPHAMALRKMKLTTREMAVVVDTAVESGRITKVVGIPEISYSGTVYYVRGTPD